MYRIVILLITGLFLGVAAWAQEEPPEEGSVPETRQTDQESEEAKEAQEIDESGLDEQSYEDVDDDFRPSEEVSTDQSVAFPTDI